MRAWSALAFASYINNGAGVRGVPGGSPLARLRGFPRRSRRVRASLDRSVQDRLKREPQLVLPVGQRSGRASRRGLDSLQEGKRGPDDIGRALGGHGGIAELEFVEQVIPAVPMHQVKQQQRTADSAGLHSSTY